MIPTLVAGLAVLVVMMTVLWLVFLRINNAAIVDVGWGMGYSLIALMSCLMTDGVTARKVLVTAMVVLWGSRLALHLLFDRVLSGKPEDGRYQDIRARWGGNLNAKFFLFFQVQSVLILLLSAPVFLAEGNPDRAISPLEWAGVAVWAAALIGETLADRQLKGFKSDPGNSGRTCRAGLWNYSRHPNYFFEWMIWVGYFLIALPAPAGWIAAVSPLLMLLILVRLTGIPLSEAQALRTRGDDYREYQRTTSAFVPWFHKRNAAAGGR